MSAIVPASIEEMLVEYIQIGGTRRPLVPKVVDELAESFKTLGLMKPISVQHFASLQKGDRVVLVAGAHRLAAAKKLGWEEIMCAVR